MTNDEAIKLLSQIMDVLLASNSWLPSTKNPIKESFGMAINALTAQPEKMQLSEEDATYDCISRQAAIEAIKTWGLIDGLSEGQAIEILADEEKLPSVQAMVLTCDGCRHVGTYDTDFPCSGCIRREKDYYEQER